VLLGDGELNEGSNWESLLIASAYKLNNLIVIIDRNKIQANKFTEDLIPLEPLADKFKAFGCEVKEIDGHSFEDIHEAFSGVPFAGSPNVIIAHTNRGNSFTELENRTDKWFCALTEAQVNEMINNL